jgi:hypothetical protein
MWVLFEGLRRNFDFVHQVLMQTNCRAEFRGLFKERVNATFNANGGLFIRRGLLPLLRFALCCVLHFENPSAQSSATVVVGSGANKAGEFYILCFREGLQVCAKVA